jgi:hypothetical protein
VINTHRPETWGYVQFSTAPPGSVTYQPDHAGPVRHLLHRVYYAEHDYRKAHGGWATTLSQLGLRDLRHPSLTGPPRLRTTTSYFEARATMRQPDGRVRRVHIRSDARVWEEGRDGRRRPGEFPELYRTAWSSDSSSG